MSAVPFLETVSVGTTSISFDALNASGGVDSIAEVEIAVSGSQRIAMLYADDGGGGITYGFLNLQVGISDLPLWMPYPMEATPAQTSAVVLAYLSDEDPAGDANTLAYLSDFNDSGSRTTLAYLSDPIVHYNPVTALPWAALYWADGPAMASTANGSSLATWVDEIANGHTATQTTAASQPVLHRNVAAWNNRSVVTFDGVNDYMTAPAFTPAIAQPDTVVVIGRTSVVPTSARNFVGGTSSSAQQSLLCSSAGQWNINAGSGLLRGTVDTKPHLFLGFFSGVGSQLTVDTTVFPSGNAGANGFAAVRLGSLNTLTQYLNGDLALVGVISRALTATETSQLHTWAQGFYGTP